MGGTTGGTTLDVVTLNVWGLPWPFSWRRRERLRAVAEAFGARTDDVVGLQELWGDAHRLLPRLGARRACLLGESGLALAGRLPPADAPRLRAFRRRRSSDRLARKGILSAPVDVAGVGAVTVLVTHLQAGAHGEVRAHQADELLSCVSETSGPVVLMGDFNFHADDPVDRATAERLEASGLTDVATAVGCDAPTWHPEDGWLPRRGPGERFDRIYVRDGARLAVRPVAADVLASPVALSDHRPLWARLSLGPVT